MHKNIRYYCLLMLPITFCSLGETKGFNAEISSSLNYDNNIYRVLEDLKRSDSYLNLKPNIGITGGYGKQTYTISYSGDYSKFREYSDANYYDHDIKIDINLEHTTKLNSDITAGFIRDHEEPGSINRIQLNIVEYNKYQEEFIKTTVGYGRKDSVGRISLDYRRTNRDYLNNGLDYLDSKIDQITTKFTYRIAPKTHIYAEYIYSELDYKPAENFELDNVYKRMQIGISWDMSNKLVGNVFVGYQDRDYDLVTLNDIDGLAYDANVSWKINTYTKLTFAGRRASIDSSLENAGGFLRTSYSANLRHEMSKRMVIFGDFGQSTDELVFGLAREDTIRAYQFGFDYDLTENIDIGISYLYEERESTDYNAEFDANSISLNIAIAMDN